MSDQGTATDQDLPRHRDAVHSYIRSIVRNETESEDLTQLVMLKAHAAIDTLGDRRRMLPWLYRIATNVCYDHFRRSGSQDRTIEMLAGVARCKDLALDTS